MEASIYRVDSWSVIVIDKYDIKDILLWLELPQAYNYSRVRNYAKNVAIYVRLIFLK